MQTFVILKVRMLITGCLSKAGEHVGRHKQVLSVDNEFTIILLDLDLSVSLGYFSTKSLFQNKSNKGYGIHHLNNNMMSICKRSFADVAN